MDLDWIAAGSSVFTALGVGFAGIQLMAAQTQARTDFEDALSRDYRDTIRSLPIEALLGETLTEELMDRHLADFYRYIDLSNEQVFLRKEGRIRTKTWKNWSDGIKDNLKKPAFAHAWRSIKLRAKDSFEELRRLERSEYRADPKEWD